MRYVVLLVLASLFWAGNFIVGKGLAAMAAPDTLTTLRYAIAAAVLLPLIAFREKKVLPPARAWLPLLGMGITGVVLFNVLQFLALDQTTAANVGIISTLNTFSIALCAALLLRERIRPLQFGAMLISFGGVLLVMTNGRMPAVDTIQSGDLWMTAAVVVFGLYSVCSRWATRDVSPMMSVCWSGIIGIIILLPFNLHRFALPPVDAAFTGALLYISLVATILCMVFWGHGVKHLGASTAGLFLNLNPVFTAVLAFVFLGESLTWIQAAGTSLVIGGCIAYTQVPKVVVAPKKHVEAA
ncbi:DMT family transporter [Alkalicoccus urumqiensis]